MYRGAPVHKHAPLLQHGAIAEVELDEPLHGERPGRAQFHAAEFGPLTRLLSEKAIYKTKALMPRPRDFQCDMNELVAWICNHSTRIRSNTREKAVRPTRMRNYKCHV